MELDELKNTWSSLGERIDKSDLFNDTVVRKIISEKAHRSTRNLLNYEMAGIVVSLLVFPLVVYLIDKRYGRYIIQDILLVFVAVFIVVALFWGVYKIAGLMKINFSKKLSENIYYINRYNIQLKREKVFTFIALAIMFLLIAIIYAHGSATLPIWTFLVCMVLLALFACGWMYRWMFNQNASIRKSLEELEELKEEK